MDSRRPIKAEEGDQEKGDINRDEYGQCSPPGINPDESRCLCEKNLNYGKESCIGDSKENAVVHSQDTEMLIFG